MRSCQRCNLVEALKDNIPLVMKLFQKFITEYSLDNETKCLHTAVIVMAMFFGQAAVQHTKICDTHIIKPNYKELTNTAQKRNSISSFSPSLLLLDKCMTELYHKQRYNSSLFYIMIADSYLNKNNNSDKRVLFPGHVFVVEKISSNEFYLYQSYINNYTLLEFYAKNDNSFRISSQKLHTFLREIHRLFTNGNVWDSRTTRTWFDFTYVSHPEFEGCNFINKSQFCYQRVPVSSCRSNMMKIIKSENKKMGIEGQLFKPLYDSLQNIRE